jgi:cytochrome c biogenesis protein CcmG/thiol:disulfide interchange protein DsbE
VVPSDELEGFHPASRWRKRLVAGMALAAALGAIVYASVRPAEQPDRRLPHFELPLLSGRGSLSSEDLEGRPAVINFWASWCGPCREETPLLERTYRAYRDQGVQFVGVNIRDSEKDARAFARKFGMTYPLVVDADQVLAEELGVYVLPQTFFVDETGSIDSASAEGAGATSSPTGLEARLPGGSRLGALTKQELEQGIKKLLAGSEDGR